MLSAVCISNCLPPSSKTAYLDLPINSVCNSFIIFREGKHWSSRRGQTEICKRLLWYFPAFVFLFLFWTVLKYSKFFRYVQTSQVVFWVMHCKSSFPGKWAVQYITDYFYTRGWVPGNVGLAQCQINVTKSSHNCLHTSGSISTTSFRSFFQCLFFLLPFWDNECYIMMCIAYFLLIKYMKIIVKLNVWLIFIRNSFWILD